MNSSAKSLKRSGVMITIAALITAAFLVQFNTTAHAQAGNVCYDATGLPIPCPDTPEPPPPPPPSKPKPTATPKPRPTRTPTSTSTETETPTATETETPTATATETATSTAVAVTTNTPKIPPSPTAIPKGGGSSQGLGQQSSLLPAVQRGGVSILIIGVLLAGGFGLWRFFSKGGTSGDGSANVETKAGPPIKPDGGSNAGREAASQFQKADSQGSTNAGREAANQFQKADSHDGGGTNVEQQPGPPQSPSSQFIKGERPPGPPTKPGL